MAAAGAVGPVGEACCGGSLPGTPTASCSLSSAPRGLRGKQGVVIIDEAAFVDQLAELLKAALAFLMWGGQVVVCSTHDGAENPFNQAIQDILSGRSKYALRRSDFDQALNEGLYQRIALVTGKTWTPEALHAFVAEPAIDQYFEKHCDRLPEFERWLFQRACERIGQPRLPDGICWCHGSRVPEGTTFSEGLLPMGAWLPRLRASVIATLDDAAAIREVSLAFDREGGFGMQFRIKLKQPIHWGPYAI